ERHVAEKNHRDRGGEQQNENNRNKDRRLAKTRIVAVVTVQPFASDADDEGENRMQSRLYPKRFCSLADILLTMGELAARFALGISAAEQIGARERADCDTSWSLFGRCFYLYLYINIYIYVCVAKR